MPETSRECNASEIGYRIKSLRRSAGLSQASLGRALGVTFQQVQKYESGRSRIAADKLHRIARALGVDVREFYGSTRDVGPGERASSTVTPEGTRVTESFDRIKDPRARYLLAELARVFREMEADR